MAKDKLGYNEKNADIQKDGFKRLVLEEGDRVHMSFDPGCKENKAEAICPDGFLFGSLELKKYIRKNTEESILELRMILKKKSS